MKKIKQNENNKIVWDVIIITEYTMNDKETKKK